MIKDLIHSAFDEESKPFWDGLMNEKLLIQYCSDCHQYIFYPRTICPHCFSEDISWQESCGNGRIYSYTVVHQAFGQFKGDTPFVVGIIELDEGVRMMSRIIGDKEQIAIDQPVSVVFAKVENELVLPYFQVT
ncbi:Zn-ribbon domain-containing OB-fold protein [Ureibacillus aquaedulcis]|uniref:Zn-ribbon domain-containing OB-fold protein n=1 Tax=Ureibacillus aquaedulcis TaxID=3058421 RepID=A0ABT8GQ15_9BACL|nr:Zn-ribbon domain-containing OB-fold protein [Ureibacillus sp. BA0131]MDN4493508.1 Zn-ribbon domain-containing OB-fold protein [Ureibacillus sp. BA0131]